MIESTLRAGAHAPNAVRLRTALPRIFLPTAVLLWAISLWQAELRIGPYGLIHSLPPAFFVAMALLNVSFLLALVCRHTRGTLLGAHLGALAGCLWLLPILLEGTARFTYTYDSYGYAEYIARTGHLQLDYPYHNWPALHLFNAALVQATGADSASLLLWSPLVVQAGMLTASAMLFRELCTTQREFWMALWLSVVFRGSGYLLPASVAGLPMLVILYVAVRALRRRSPPPDRHIEHNVGKILLIGAVVTTHLMHSWLLFVDLSLLWLLATFLRRKDAGITAAVLTAVLVVAWMFYVASGMTTVILRSVVEEVLDFDAVLSTTRSAALVGSPEHTVVFSVRLAYVAVMALLGLAGFLQELISQRDIRLERLVPAAWVAGAVSLTLLTTYGGEVLGRAYYAAFFALVVLAARHARGVAFAVLGVVVTGATLLYPINAWGNEAVDHVPPSEIQAVRFVQDYRPVAYSVRANPVRIWKWMRIESVNQRGAGVTLQVGGWASARTAAYLRGVIEEASDEVAPGPPLQRIYESGEVTIWAEDNGPG